MQASHPQVPAPSHPFPSRLPARAGALLLLAALAVAPLAAQDDMAGASLDLNVMNLGNGVSAIGGGLDGSVLVVEGGGEALVVDGQGPVGWSALVQAVPLATEAKVRWVVNTHYHADHVGSNAHYGAEGVSIVAHMRTAEYLSRPGGVPELNWEYEALPEEGWPTVVLEGGGTLKLGNRLVRLIHLRAAHTDGDLAVYVPHADVLHTGDVFDHGNYPFVDLWHGGTVDGMIAAVDTLIALTTETTQIVPGHGPPCGRDELLAYRAMLEDVRGKVNAALDAGMSLDELISTVPTADYDGTFGQPGGGRRLVALFYKDLSERRAMQPPR